MKMTYTCEFCGKTSSSKEEITACEAYDSKMREDEMMENIDVLFELMDNAEEHMDWLEVQYGAKALEVVSEKLIERLRHKAADISKDLFSSTKKSTIDFMDAISKKGEDCGSCGGDCSCVENPLSNTTFSFEGDFSEEDRKNLMKIIQEIFEER